MERETNVKQLAQEAEIASDSRSNDEDKAGKKSDDELPCAVQMSDCDTLRNNNDSKANIIDDTSGNLSTITFKKPTPLIGPRHPRSIEKSPNTTVHVSENIDSCTSQATKSPDPSPPYTEPSWSGKPQGNYKMEVLKSGTIIDTLLLNEQSFYIIGRLPSCHVSLAHPTISRYHAVLQYRLKEDKENSKGFYVYDLGSTHGTFWNGNRIKPNTYVRVQGGHMLRFGCSHRKYILEAPLDDQEEESQYTVSELKEMRRQRANEQAEAASETKESEGIDWGMGEDADEETDAQENPYACITDDDLTLDDPKKTLRGWFEREGYELQYQTEEKGLGQFLCWVDLPMDDVVGRSVRAEALVKGKKKEAVVQCAMEACKILDKYGLLRQANHEARKRKARNWEAEDYYDSDEDNFLDRTGLVERKREQRMRLAGKLEEKVETYDSLLEKHKEVTKRIAYLSNSIKNWQSKESNANAESMEEDALDAFMSSLSSSALTKSDITKMKLELLNLHKEDANLIKLLNLTRPANLPPLISYAVQAKTDLVQGTTSKSSKSQDSASRLWKKKQANCQAGARNASSITNAIIDSATQAKSEGEEEEEEVEEEDDEEEEDNDDAKNENGEGKERSESLDSLIVATPDTSAAVAATAATGTTQKRKQEQEVKMTKKRQRQKAYEQDAHGDNYSTWVPPLDQVGDGKTSLNEKYGY